MKEITSFPLKERKRARIRLALAESVIKRTQDRSFGETRVETLCQDAEISRATFFRLFPKKIDLIFYVINLWIIEIGWHLNQTGTAESGFQKISRFFQLSADAYEKHQNFFIEAIGQRALDPVEFNRQDNESNRVGLIERLIRFPDLDGIESMPEGGFTILLKECIESAIKDKKLPMSTDPEKAVLALACLFYGVPIMVSDRSSVHLAKMYSEQLEIIWEGLGGRTL